MWTIYSFKILNLSLFVHSPPGILTFKAIPSNLLNV